MEQTVFSWEFPDPHFAFMRMARARYSYPLHTHAFTELIIILHGDGQHILDDVTYPIAAGDVFIVNTQVPHAYADTRDLQLVNLLYRPEFLQFHEAELRQLPGYLALFVLEPTYRRQHQFRSHLRLAPAIFTEVADLLTRIEAEYTTRPPGHQPMTLALFVQLLILLSRQYSAAPTASMRVLMQLGAVISHIEQAYTEPITLAALADIAHMSPRTLVRRFTEGLGLPPIEYLIHWRIQRGAALLRGTDHSVADIAAAVGFTDSNYFTRQFTRINGRTPRQYRQTAPPG